MCVLYRKPGLKMLWAQIPQCELGRTEVVGFTGLCRIPQQDGRVLWLLTEPSGLHLRITLDFGLLHLEARRELLVTLPCGFIRCKHTMSFNPLMLDSA